MTTSIKNLKNEVDSRLAAGGLDALECCQLQNAQKILNNSVVTKVPNLASLPSAALNEGRLVYVDDINEYRISNGIEWSSDVSSTTIFFYKELWSWGTSLCGRLGDGSTENRFSPVREISSSIDWCSVSAANAHTAAIKSTGQLWAWGRNLCGTLGNGNTILTCSPVREFCSATDWCQASAGGVATAAIKTSGQLWAWGRNIYGVLGDGTITERCSPVRERCSATDWCQVSLGYRHAAAVKTTGQIWAWGCNVCGALGDGTFTSRCSPVREFCSATDWCQVGNGYSSTHAVKTSGQLWSWGFNFCGQLADGTATTRCSPVREFCSATDWCGIGPRGNANGTSAISAIKTTGQIWTWGSGLCGRLGDGTLTDRCSPVREFCSATDWCQVSSNTWGTLAVKTTGQIWGWGNNQCGQLGDGTAVGRCSPVREISSSVNWSSVSAGSVHTTAIRSVCKGFL